MTIRRKRRPAATESTRPAAQVRSEVVQKNLERMRLLANASSTRPANAGMPSQAEREPAYTASNLASTSELLARDNESEPSPSAPTPAPTLNVEQALAAAGEQVLNAMQEAQKSIMAAESILLHQETSTDDGIVRAQKIAEEAVAQAVNQSADALRAAMEAEPANITTPTPVTPTIPSPVVPEIPTPVIASFSPPVSPEIFMPVLADFPAPVVPETTVPEQSEAPAAEPTARGQVQ